MSIGIHEVFPPGQLHSHRVPIDAVRLHSFLGIREPFYQWVHRHLEALGAKLDRDYHLKVSKRDRSKAGVWLTMAIACDICGMTEGAKAKIAFRYLLPHSRNDKEVREAIERIENQIAILQEKATSILTDYFVGIVMSLSPAKQDAAIAKLESVMRGCRHE